MKIMINTATTCKGGSVQVARSFIEECKNFREYEYHVILGEKLSDLIEPECFSQNFSFYPIGYRPATRVLSFNSPDRDLKKIEDTVRPDVVFTTSGPAYWRPGVPHLVGYNLPHYIYRDSPYFFQIPFYKRLRWELKGQALKFFFKREADAYVVQTDDVNRRLRQWLQSDRVYTVSNTYSRYYDDPKYAASKLPEKQANEFRFLSLSAWYPHKNMDIIPRVVNELPRRLRDRVRFVLTLPDNVFRNIFPNEIKDNIINIGPVKPDEGPALYKECDALFLPTLLECFSASYAEAMKMEKPIVTSDLDFARTVCKNAALYVNPVNAHDISKKITELIENQSLQEKLVRSGVKLQKKFITAEIRAKTYLKICKELADDGKN